MVHNVQVITLDPDSLATFTAMMPQPAHRRPKQNKALVDLVNRFNHWNMRAQRAGSPPTLPNGELETINTTVMLRDGAVAYDAAETGSELIWAFPVVCALIVGGLALYISVGSIVNDDTGELPLEYVVMGSVALLVLCGGAAPWWLIRLRRSARARSELLQNADQLWRTHAERSSGTAALIQPSAPPMSADTQMVQTGQAKQPKSKMCQQCDAAKAVARVTIDGQPRKLCQTCVDLATK